MTGASQVHFDARDAFTEPLRGWGRYALELTRRLPPDLVTLHKTGVRGPEMLWEQVTFPRILRRAQASVVHSPNCFLPLRRPCPGVVTIHDLAFEAHPEDFARSTGAKYRFFAPRAVRSAERVICVSQATADDVAARYGADESKLRVIPNAASLPMNGAAPAPADSPYLLAVGDIRGKKNLARLLDAFARLRADGLQQRLVLAGQGELPAGAPDGVQATGFVDDATLDALMRGADLLVHPSLYEGFGLVVLEAMARGVPVAIADATSLPEVAGGAAERFDPLDTDDMAAAILRALSRRDELAALGLARASEFSWDATAAATVDVYRELL